ncbi:hypothetical protein [Turneriella parva]|uniref:Lipoprotein n=1 Tax=Turneriella parva (strain ATCC BAA-1111 / DSM 21527 / NCTC 11395 / H) TaxID=869212 RepID=I4B5B2_TURPD|nr:hypothetical protein [Turneriella parva]AFM12469.1 hypothetical protein Turpa_1822 [Turneriella parva DSM 21527]
MRNLKFYIAVAAVFAVTGCKSGDAPKERFMFTGKTDPQVEKLLGGIDVYADAVRVIPVIVNSDPNSGGKKENLEGYAIVKKGKIMTPDQVKKLQSVVFDVNVYDFNSSKRCLFSPYIGFIFEKGGKQSHALFCFTCNEVSYGRDGKQGNLEDFDPARKEILSLARELFPNDAKLAAIKDEL